MADGFWCSSNRHDRCNSAQSVLRDRSARTQPPEHEANHRESDPGHATRDRRFVVSDETPTLQEPSKGAFNDPALRQHNEPMLRLSTSV